MPYLGHSLGKSYPSVEMQSMYSTAPQDWAKKDLKKKKPVCFLLSFILLLMRETTFLKEKKKHYEISLKVIFFFLCFLFPVKAFKKDLYISFPLLYVLDVFYALKSFKKCY